MRSFIETIVAKHRLRNSDGSVDRPSARSSMRAVRDCHVATRRRRGIALMIVLVTISTSLILSFAFLQTQATARQISENVLNRDRALQAARTGATYALKRLQSADWDGVDEELSRIVESTDEGTTSFDIQFLPLTSSRMNPLPDDAALYVVVQSTGTWQSRRESDRRAQRVVELIVRLRPRIPGRTIYPGDLAWASDLTSNPPDYDEIRNYTLFAHDNSQAVRLEPATRINGPTWIGRHLQIYNGLNWSSSIRRDYLDSLGELLSAEEDGSPTSLRHPLPHPITFGREPASSITQDLARLNCSWTTGDETFQVPEISISHWTSYRLYEGGFSYQAAQVPATLRNTTLGPTPDNPLGIFVREGSVTLADNVTIQGTLVTTGRITITGRNVRICSSRWKGASSSAITHSGTEWPRLPAIIANEMSTSSRTQAFIEGAVVVRYSVEAAGLTFELANAANIQREMACTIEPIQQPLSLVRVGSSASLDSITADGDYSLWIEDAYGGRWHPIVDVDEQRREMKIVGEVVLPDPTVCRVRRSRRQCVEIRGFVTAQSLQVHAPAEWTFSSLLWSLQYSRWNLENDVRRQYQQPPIPLAEWLSSPANFIGWTYPQSTYGLPNEPTFRISGAEEWRHHWEPPIFTPFRASGEGAAHSGYRWELVSWREPI